MLIAEDLLLLVLDDISGRPTSGLNASKLDLLIGGALVSELALSGAVHLQRNPGTDLLEIHPTGVGLPHDPCLQRCLTFAGGRPRPAPLITSCGTQMFDHLIERLVHRGMLRREQQKRFLITRTTWPAAETSYKQEVRRHLAAALFDARGVHPTQRTATLIGHLAAADQVHRLFVSPGVAPAYVMQRADHISRGDWVAATVRGIFRAPRSGWGGGGGGGDIGGGGDGGGGGGGGGGE